jgi:hypothetical protein
MKLEPGARLSAGAGIRSNATSNALGAAFLPLKDDWEQHKRTLDLSVRSKAKASAQINVAGGLEWRSIMR